MNGDSMNDDSKGSRWLGFAMRCLGVVVSIGFVLWLFVYLLRNGDDDRKVEFAAMLFGGVIAIVGLVSWMFEGFGKCPKCGKYAFGKEKAKNPAIETLKNSLAPHRPYWDVCRKCGYRQYNENDLHSD